MKTWWEDNKLTTVSLTCGLLTLVFSQCLDLTPRIIFTASSSLLIGMGVMMGSLCWLQEEALKQSAHDMQVMHEANKQLLITLIDHVENEEA